MKNNKGYMLVEIILASAIAFGIAIFIINLTIKLKNKNDDELVESEVEVDRALINNKLLHYARELGSEFDCKELKTNSQDNTIYYGDELIDIVNDYATISDEFNCSVTSGRIRIMIPVTVPQQSDKDYDIVFEYKFQISDITLPQLTVEVDEGQKWKKQNTAIIVISDNEGLEEGTYNIRYGWSPNGIIDCENSLETTTMTVSTGDTRVESEPITISDKTGYGTFYACNENLDKPIYDHAYNELIRWNENPAKSPMYLDNTPPTCELNDDVAFVSKNDMHSGILTFGMSKGDETVIYNKTSKLDFSYSTYYYGFVKDNAGNENVCNHRTPDPPPPDDGGGGGSSSDDCCIHGYCGGSQCSNNTPPMSSADDWGCGNSSC